MDCADILTIGGYNTMPTPIDTKVDLTLNRLSWSQFKQVSAESGISPDQLWFIQESNVSG